MLPCLAYTELLASPVNAFNFEKTRQLCKMVVDFVNPLFSDSNSSLWQKLKQLQLIFFFWWVSLHFRCDIQKNKKMQLPRYRLRSLYTAVQFCRSATFTVNELFVPSAHDICPCSR